MTRAIVELHGGTIDVRSSDAAGTLFTVRLPR
jgi:signal transduction histidine kinase